MFFLLDDSEDEALLRLKQQVTTTEGSLEGRAG